MKIKKIILKNIRSYEHEEVIFKEGSTLLSGDIGSGKTSVLIGIEFALFGLQPGQKGSSILRNNANEGGVEMEFEINEKKIIVERKLKRGKSISQENCSITINGNKQEISVTELKNRILDLLNYPKEFSKKQNLLYKFTVYTPQEEMKQIILQDSQTRINTLRHVFGIDKYKRVLENTSIIVSKIREEKRIKEGMLINFEQETMNIFSKEKELEEKKLKLVGIEKDLLLKSEKRKKIQEEREGLVKKKEEKMRISQEIEKTKIMMNNKRELELENKKLAGQIIIQIEELKKIQVSDLRIEELEKEIILKKNERQKLQDKNFEINSKINALEIKIGDTKKLESKISSLEVCPTCLQNVEAIYRANVLNKTHNDISKCTSEIKELEFQKIEFIGKVQKIDEKIILMEREISELKIRKIKLQELEEKKSRLQHIENSSVNLKKDVEMLIQHIALLMNSLNEIGKIDLRFEEKQKEFEEALRLERLAELSIAGTKKEIMMFSNQIEELKEKMKKLEEVRNKMNYLVQLEDWLTKSFVPLIENVEKNVMAKLKSEFSSLFVKWFNMLVAETFNVRLSDDFTPIIEQQDYEIDYAYLSGGERTAIALAYRLALNQVINSLLSKIETKDVVILDEPTDGFSSQQLDKMREVLEQLDIRQLIIVSHEQKIEGFVENVVRFKKLEGKSSKE